jgi:hypothetical protein
MTAFVTIPVDALSDLGSDGSHVVVSLRINSLIFDRSADVLYIDVFTLDTTTIYAPLHLIV